MNSLPKTVSCDLNPGPTAPESSTLTTRLPSHPDLDIWAKCSLTLRAVRCGAPYVVLRVNACADASGYWT